MLERLAGLDVERRVPWTLEQDIVVFNPTPQPRTDVVRIALDAYPAMRMPLGVPEFAPLSLAAMEQPGFAIDGRPVRVVATDDPTRARWLPGEQPFDVELVAADVPAFGCRRFRLTPCAPVADVVDDGRVIEADDVARRGRRRRHPARAPRRRRVSAGCSRSRTAAIAATRTTSIRSTDDPGAVLESVAWQRRRHPSGIARLEVRRVLRVPAGARRRRASAARRSRCRSPSAVEARVAPGVPRVDLTVRVDNTARDHRLRLLLSDRAAGRDVSRRDDLRRRASGRRRRPTTRGWVHPAPTTFAHQGWVSANGLTVVAPGLPEAEVTPDGRIAITLLRAVGWLARFDLRSRPIPAGPPMEVPGAQMLGALEARLSLLAGGDPGAARAAELGLRGVIGGAEPLLADGVALLALEPGALRAVGGQAGGARRRHRRPRAEPDRRTRVTARLRVGLPIAAAHAPYGSTRSRAEHRGASSTAASCSSTYRRARCARCGWPEDSPAVEHGRLGRWRAERPRAGSRRRARRASAPAMAPVAARYDYETPAAVTCWRAQRFG